MYPLHKHIARFVSLTEEEFEFVRSHFKETKLKKRQFLVQEGMPVLYDWYVVKGCLKAYQTDAQGKDHILQFAMEDWWVTDYGAYFRQEPASIHIDCLEASELLALPLEKVDFLCDELPKMERYFRKRTQFGYVALQRRILSLLNNTARERYEQLFSLYPHLFQRVPKKYLAAYLGVSRETLSRLDSSK